MALGGGTWLVQNKVLPGSYINFSSVAKASATLSDRGYAAAPFVLSWGPENEVFAVTSGEFQKNSKAIFGYSYDHPKMLALREIFLHATTVYCYRLGLGAKKAACALAIAKYPGVRGNDLSIVIAVNVDDPDAFDVGTYLDGIQVDLQTVTKAEDLTGNDYVDFKKDLTLEATAGAPLTGGEDVANITGDSHQAFLDKIEAYAFNAMCCPAADPIIVKLYAAYCQRVRDEVGAKFQLIAWKPSTVDYEGVIGVWNSATHPSMDVEEHAVVYWATGAHAGVAVNKSLTNAKYDGELTLNTDYKQAELTAALKAGKFMFHNVNGLTRVLEDINTLLTLSDTKGEVFQSNQTMRVCDQIANDVAVLFNERYLGTVPNDASGRSALWGDITHYIKQLEDIRAVENFDPDTVSCEQGDKKKAVLVTVNGLNIINAMAQLYMSVIIQ
ncbi:phage tail sheath family protein [Acutalibacter caecimuris]|uniref:phage tail sheath family protein n=1 Tax=Acutalibacter caecimuris TaxID=3093657 RepID=UPI002AC8B21C|nr:phage tail sheath family protein [Acutalibacter sp. M00118]